MARFWSEPYDSVRHRNPMGLEVADSGNIERYHRAATLEPHHVFFVTVAGFTFEFHGIEQLRACLGFYSTAQHGSRRSSAAAAAVNTGEVPWRWEVERWHERLPLYLREEPKRVKVVAALEEALRRVEAGRL